MNPAFSVIFLTTLIGAGQGLFAAIVLGQPHFVDIATAGFTVADSMSSFVFLGCGISFLLMMMGLIASFFHLGHPERAWRAVFQWKTSWLSREVIVMPLVMGVVVVYGAFHLFDAAVIKQQVGFDLVSLMGWVGFILVMILYLCTAMIYACIRFIQEWSSPLTVINYTVLGLMSGFVLASALSFQTEPQRFELYFILALSLLVVGLITRSLSLYRNGRIKPKSTMETAIGIKHRLITQRSQGSMGGSFNTRDFFHHCAGGYR